jgi:hypothetical protein
VEATGHCEGAVIGLLSPAVTTPCRIVNPIDQTRAKSGPF